MSWVFVTNHAAVFLYLAHNPSSTIRQMMDTLALGKRTILRITSDLERDGYLSKRQVGRRNHYTVNPELPLRRPEMAHVVVGKLLKLLGPDVPGRNRGIERVSAETGA